MKKILNILKTPLLIVVFCLALTSCTEKSEVKTLYVATSPDYAPFEFVDSRKTGDDKYIGADIELAKFIADELSMKLKLQPMGFDETLVAVQMGKVDLAISGYTYKEERAQNYELSISYREDGEGYQGVLILKSKANIFGSFADLNKSSVKVGAQAGSIQEDYVNEQLPNATLEKIGSITDAVEYLKSGKIDALAIASAVADTIVRGDDRLQMMDEHFVIENSNLYVIAKKGNTELIGKVNKAIEKVVEYDLYNIWTHEYKAILAILGDYALEEDYTGKENN